MAKYILGAKSLRELVGVHPDLVKVVKRAIELTTQDFIVHDGLRTIAEQRKLVASGASQTMESRHITGHAVDLVPYINKKVRWEWPPAYLICNAVREAAREFNVPIIWGGSWDTILNNTSETPAELVVDYVERRRNVGKKRVFLDAPHFELPKSIYP